LHVIQLRIPHPSEGRALPPRSNALLQEGWVIANHILVSFHVAFISSVLALPPTEIFKGEVLKFIFLSPETIVSALFMYISFHAAIALHEMGHWMTAAKLNALNDASQGNAMKILRAATFGRWTGLLRVFALAPYGKAPGIKVEKLNYYPDAPYNLAVAAAGPRVSRNVALVALPPAALLLVVGLALEVPAAIYAGRLLLGVGIVCFLDFLLADRGKYREFRRREQRAEAKAAAVKKGAAWWERAPEAHRRMLTSRIEEVTHPSLGPVTAPWQFRNCGMGGRHTEKEYPESNISMQEAMFLILGARDYQVAQEMTVRLQNRLKEIIEKAEGCRVMGIGLEGGIAPYIERGTFPMPEVRLWAMMKQTIEECGYRPGVDVAIALDPAMSELEIAYRKHNNVPDAVGMYLFWRDKALAVLDRDGVLDLYIKAIQDYDIPILSIEDGFSENDFEGWKKLLSELGDRVFIIGDDLVTTNDETIELASTRGLINTSLIKANQIGTLYETILAMLVALGKGQELVVSHRSKSPNDDMEAQIALAVNALGLKAGGGANTERLIKYHAVTEYMQRGFGEGKTGGVKAGQNPVVSTMYACEEPTNAGVPTVGTTVEFMLPVAGVALRFRGATPLGTSAGSGEAIHLVDSAIEHAEYREVIDRHRTLFREIEPGVHAFLASVDDEQVLGLDDEELEQLFYRSQRYDGKGCLTAVENVLTVIAPAFAGRIASTMTLKDVDSRLLSLELHVARRRGKIEDPAPANERIRVMQRKQNLGMNAMLSVSLAVARGIAHLRGLELFELLREEIYSIVDKITLIHGVKIGGSTFSDYTEALRKVNARLESQGKKLYVELRELTGIYEDGGSGPETGVPAHESKDAIPSAVLDLVEEILPRLGHEFRANAHHGLRHARDLLSRAAGLVGSLDVHDEVDWRVLAAGITLHDFAAASADHSEVGAAAARDVLVATGRLSTTEIERVQEAIRLHQDRSKKGARLRADAGIEAQILYDVDQLDAFGVKGVYRYIAVWSQRGVSLDGILDDAKERYGSLTFEETRELAAPDYTYTESFFLKLASERLPDGSLRGATGVVDWVKKNAATNPVELSDGALSALQEEPTDADITFAADFFKALRTVYSEGETPIGVRGPSPSTTLAPTPLLTGEENEWLSEFNTQLFHAYREETDSVIRHEVLHAYVALKQRIARRTKDFGIVNNRIFLAPDRMFIPYLGNKTLVVYEAHDDVSESIIELKILPGTIMTDALVKRLAGFDGQPIDLEYELFEYDERRAVPVSMGMIRDIVEQLKSINESANRNQVVYVLRILVAQLSVFSFKYYLTAKNLQSEVYNLLKELIRFINAPLSARLPFLVRILVRDVAAVVTRPKLIDRLWNDTIDLAEIHVRGSAIVNELRRSTHHAVGRRTLRLAKVYATYLETGETDGLASVGFLNPSPVDEEARKRDQPKRIANRIVDDLEQLLGSSETIARIRDWQSEFDAILFRCEFGKSLAEEMNAVVEAIHEAKRWVFYHHIRIIKGRILDFSDHMTDAGRFVDHLDQLLALRPDEDGFVPIYTEAKLRDIIESFTSLAKASYENELFGELEDLIAAYAGSEFYQSFMSISRLRKTIRTILDQRAFPEQRLLLLKLDCLLEEMGYIALRHVASEYTESGTDILQCLEIIYECALNLTHDGMHSRQLSDLASMLCDRNKTFAEVRNIVEHIHRNYHHILQRVISPFERIRDKLQFDEEELQTALANIQRYMHDLNSIAYFTDIARTYIDEVVEDHSRTVGGAAQQIGDPFDVIHLSHTDMVRSQVESDEHGENLRCRYGGKGSGLVYISYHRIPTRNGFIFPTTLGKSDVLSRNGERLGEELLKHVRILEGDIEQHDGVARHFGDPERPLLLAVRGGSVFSMPGMLSTVLFVGMNDEIAAAMAEEDPWCAYDSYRRFLAQYAQAVWDIDMESYDIVEDTKRRYQVAYKYDLPWEGMQEITEATKNLIEREGHGAALEEILRDPFKQLCKSVQAILDSWNNEAARRYRNMKGICDSWHTAVIIQEMALGNRKGEEIRPGMDETRTSLTGVIPRTQVTALGVRELVGDFKFSAAGEDLVGGVTRSTSFHPIEELATYMPMLNRRLRHNVAKLRRFMGTDQDIEFTVERGVLSILQSRAAEIGKNSREAAFVDAGEEAAHGIGIRGTAFRGLVAFDEKDREEMALEDLSERDDVDGTMLILDNPAPENIPLILSADALLTARGGSTSHAAISINGVQGRDYNAVMGVTGLKVNARKHEATIVGKDGSMLFTIRKGDIVSIHGTTGTVYVGSRQLTQA
jgi:enolase/phosphoenolpyruvate synthase/pyruvate phosphate dikinase